MSYVLPQTIVYQEFKATPSSQSRPLRAFVAGPHAQLIRFAESAEQANGLLGYYDAAIDTEYTWPSKPACSLVDSAYVKLFCKDALLQYFTDNTTCTRESATKIKSSAVNFIENTGTYPRAASLYDRDVTAGDTVKAVFTVSSNTYTTWSYVAGFEADAVDSVIAAAAADSDNAATTGGATAVATQTVGPWNTIEAATASASAYNGYARGTVTETYTIVVTQSSVGGDLTTAKLRVISASGLDDVENVTPSAAGVATAIGTLGLTVTFNHTADEYSQSASDANISPDDFLAGQRWAVAVTAAFTAPTVTNNAGSGAYTGTQDTTYVVEVVTGGKFASATPQIRVTTTTGYDISGPTSVASGVAAAVGTKGLTITFTATGLRKGDRWTIAAAAEGEGNYRTIILGHNISASVPDDTPCELTLYIRKPELEIDINREGYAPQTNYTVAADTITVASGILVYDETWTDGGTPMALPLVSADSQEYGAIYVETRYWLSNLASEIGTIDDIGNIDALIPGELDIDNPLKWAVSKALGNANDVEVKYCAVANPDSTTSWNAPLELALGTDAVYGFVPLTRNRTVLGAYQAHVNKQSQPEEGLWRVLWTSLEGLPAIPVVHAGSTVPGYTAATTGDSAVCLCTITDNPNVAGSQYTLVVCPAGNGNFVTNGVRAGDIVRAVYAGDGFGGTAYSEYVVDRVDTEDQLTLLTGPAAAVNTASKIEIWRNLTATEEAQAVAVNAGSWGNRRVMAVWPDTIETSGTVQEGYHLCAALAGLASGVVPQQGLTNVEISGFTNVRRTTGKFNKSQLNTMAQAGVWIVTQDVTTGKIFTRHAVTTGDTAILQDREEMLVRNVDSISYRYKEHFAPFIGVTNVTPATIDLLEMEVASLNEVLKTEKATSRLGGQIIEAVIASIQQSPLYADRVDLVLNVTAPYPLNNFSVHLVI